MDRADRDAMANETNIVGERQSCSHHGLQPDTSHRKEDSPKLHELGIERGGGQRHAPATHRPGDCLKASDAAVLGQHGTDRRVFQDHTAQVSERPSKGPCHPLRVRGTRAVGVDARPNIRRQDRDYLASGLPLCGNPYNCSAE